MFLEIIFSRFGTPYIRQTICECRKKNKCMCIPTYFIKQIRTKTGGAVIYK